MKEPTKPLPQEWVFDDFSVGQVFESQRRTITEADVVGFAAWSWDTNPVHTDAVGQTDSIFGGRIAHGILGLAVAMGLGSRIGVFEGCSIALLGVNNWRFMEPIHLGDTLRLRIEITGTTRTSDGRRGILNRHFTLLDQRDHVVQSGDIGLMVRV